MTAVLFTPPYAEFMDANGAPLSGGKVYAYTAGTLTPKNTFTDSTEATPNANPVILDSAGRAAIWINGSYKFIVKDSADTTIRTVDNVTSFSTSATTLNSLLPSQTGNAGKFLTTDGVNSSWGSASSVTLGTTVATTSGTSIDFTGLPVGVKQIFLALDGVGAVASDNFWIQIGDSGGIETASNDSNTVVLTTATTGTVTNSTSALVAMDRNGLAVSGTCILTLVDTATNTWSASFVSKAGTSRITVSSGSKSLSTTLDRVRLTTVGGATTFNAGKMNIQYQ